MSTPAPIAVKKTAKELEAQILAKFETKEDMAVAFAKLYLANDTNKEGLHRANEKIERLKEQLITQRENEVNNQNYSLGLVKTVLSTVCPVPPPRPLKISNAAHSIEGNPCRSLARNGCGNPSHTSGNTTYVHGKCDKV